MTKQFVEIGEIIRPVGDEHSCLIISEVDENGLARCIWEDGKVGYVLVGDITCYGKIFKDVLILKKGVV